MDSAPVVAVEVSSRRSELFVKVERLLNDSQLHLPAAHINSAYLLHLPADDPPSSTRHT